MGMALSISEETIKGNLAFLLENSDPGDTLHKMHVFAAGPDAIGPLGTVDESKLRSASYMIVPPGPGQVRAFIQTNITRVTREARERGEQVLFAALSMEAWAVEPMDELGYKLLAENRLNEHPAMFEETTVYGAAADGRRWTGRRFLTGPRAGTTEYSDVMVGPLLARERRTEWQMLRLMVGQQR